jgi:ribonuclease R
MKFTIAALLSQLSEDKLVAPKQLEKKLGCETESEQQQLQIALDALEKSNFLLKERGKYRRQERPELIEARLRCSSKGFCFAIRDDVEDEDVYIRESQLHGAWNGDRVFVKLTREGGRRRSPEGEVNLILERANSTVLACIRQEEEQFVAVPLDDRLLCELALQPEADTDLTEAVNHLANVSVTRYPLAQFPAQGRITRVLGSSDDIAPAIEIVCCKHSLLREFPTEVAAAAAQIPSSLPTGLEGDRLDLRPSLLFALLPAEDVPTIVDTAFSVEARAIGGWRLGIHTIDLSPFISADSALDREARRRGSTIYLGDTVLPLFPLSISSGIGSFVSGEDRLAISLLVELDVEGRVESYEIQPSVVRLRHLLNESQINEILERPAGRRSLPKAIKAFEDCFEALDQLIEIGVFLRRHRHERGGFEFTLPEPTVGGTPLSNSLDPFPDEGHQSAVLLDRPGSPRACVREIAVLANELVGRHLQALGLPALYRLDRHPDITAVQDVLKLAASLDLSLPEVEGEITPLAFQSVIAALGEGDVERVVLYLLKDTLKPATYSTQPGRNFGLALDQGYVHFVSPTRRYADFFTQRLLSTLFQDGRDRRSPRAKEGVNLRSSSCQGQVNWSVLPPAQETDFSETVAGLAAPMSDRDKQALEAETDWVGFKKAGYMKAHVGDVFPGVITGVQSYGFFVEVEELLVEGLVHVSSLKDDWYEYRSRQQRLIGRKGRRQYALGDQVQVEVKNVDYYRQQIDLVVVESEEASVGAEGLLDSADLAPADLPSPLDLAEPFADESEQLTILGEDLPLEDDDDEA